MMNTRGFARLAGLCGAALAFGLASAPLLAAAPSAEVLINQAERVVLPAGTAKDVRAMLEAQVAKVIAAGHLAPYRCEYCEGDAFYIWTNPGQNIQVLAETIPYLSPELAKQLKAYLKREWQAYDPLKVFVMPLDKGARREFYPLPAGVVSRETGRWMGMYGNNYARLKRNGYAAWAYAHYTGDWQTLASDMPALLRVANKSTGPVKYEDLADMIGIARIARKLGNAGLAKAAGERLSQMLAQLPAFDEMVRRADAAYTGVKGKPTPVRYDRVNVFENLTPETARLIRQTQLAPAKAMLASINRKTPYWFVGAGPALQGDILRYTEGSAYPPGLAERIFAGEALLAQVSAEQLRIYLDAPVAKVGDLDYIRKLTLICRSLGQVEWVNLGN